MSEMVAKRSGRWILIAMIAALATLCGCQSVQQTLGLTDETPSTGGPKLFRFSGRARARRAYAEA